MELLREDIESPEGIDSRSKNKVRFKSATRKYLDASIRLTRMKEQLEREIEELEAQKNEIDFTIDYVTDAAINIDEFPTAAQDLMEDLENQIEMLKELSQETGKQIGILRILVGDVEKAIDSAINFLLDIVKEFEQKYPKVPRIMGNEWVEFLKNNSNFLKLKPNYKEDLKELDDLVAEIEDFEITANEEKVADMKKQIEELQKTLTNTEQEILAKQTILDKFKEVAELYKQQKVEEEKIKQNNALISAYIGTHEKEMQNIPYGKSYEPSSKKSNDAVITSTISSDDNKPHLQRANKFGFNFHSFKNKDKIKGVVVTSKTEDAILPGLTSHLLSSLTPEQKLKYKEDEVIALVMVEENSDGTITLVDENGKSIEEGEDKINSAIYQVFPMAELKALYPDENNPKIRTLQSMFRKDIDEDERTQREEWYKQWRTEQLLATSLSSPVIIAPSFGIAEYAKDERGERDYTARVTAQEAGLLSEEELQQTNKILVSTEDSATSDDGSVTFSKAKGRVFLKIPNGLAKLFNRKFTEKEASTIFSVIKQISENGVKSGELTEETNYMINWLKSVLYWGIAKDPDTGKQKSAGYNNVWFENVDGINKLFISGIDTQEGFIFTPTSL
ncbi:MAG TPA: hypothetical protein PLR64_03520, partial [Candidatus Dojkabacteria bacterium]|nr:hypothetical protein [Candidatus Dojkabacteria bacterium]